MSTEAQRVDDSPSTSGGSSDGDQRESVQQEPEREQVQPKKKEGKISSKTAAKLSTSAKRIQKELAEITLDPPPNCRQKKRLQNPKSSLRNIIRYTSSKIHEKSELTRYYLTSCIFRAKCYSLNIPNPKIQNPSNAKLLEC
uniref:Ubiquitin conjugating enzyme E2 E2 n=1 Tax=Oryctolagus cuniculus TaxID=9986 RepID=A0A5F9CUI9_RABIT